MFFIKEVAPDKKGGREDWRFFKFKRGKGSLSLLGKGKGGKADKGCLVVSLGKFSLLKEKIQGRILSWGGARRGGYPSARRTQGLSVGKKDKGGLRTAGIMSATN